MTQKTNTMAALTVAGLLAVLAPAFAAQNDTKGSLSQQDQMFAMDAAAGNMKEIESGQLASSKATNQAVKDHGKMMVTDHTNASQQLMQIASKKGISLPKALTAEHKENRDALANTSGAAFDQLYVQQMIKDHEKTIALFEKQAQDGKDAELRAFAEQTLPKLRQHLEHTRTLATTVGAGHSGH
jgi:putative membrane protein